MNEYKIECWKNGGWNLYERHILTKEPKRGNKKVGDWSNWKDLGYAGQIDFLVKRMLTFEMRGVEGDAEILKLAYEEATETILEKLERVL